MPAGYFMKVGVVVFFWWFSERTVIPVMSELGQAVQIHMKPVVLMGANREIKKLNMRAMEKVMLTVFLGGAWTDGRLDA